MKIIKLSITFYLLFVSIFCSAQSFEGYIDQKYPVWVDLNFSSNDNNISGTYFYKKMGGDIKVQGTYNGQKIIINEKNKEGAITGTFKLNNYNDSIIGTWKKNGSNKLLDVKLFKTNPDFKQFAIIPKNDKLILNDGTTLHYTLNNAKSETDKKGPKLEILYAEKNILSTSFNQEIMYNYRNIGGLVFNTFNLVSKKEIKLTNEIAPEKFQMFKTKLLEMIKQQLMEHRKSISEEEWMSAYGNDKDALEAAFNKIEIDNNIIDIYYIKNNHIIIYMQRFLGLPTYAMALDLDIELDISPSEIKKYLKSNSILNNLNSIFQ
jgi:hypothetical protein